MADEQQVARLRQGDHDWNSWRAQNPGIIPDLADADLQGILLGDANLANAVLTGANLSKATMVCPNIQSANLTKANLSDANFVGAKMSGVILAEANLNSVYLTGAELVGANLSNIRLGGMANFVKANLTGANLSGSVFPESYFGGANLTGAILRDADLAGANFPRAILKGADLTGANLTGANMVEADLSEADLTGCRVYGVSAWGLTLDASIQRDLIITSEKEAAITVDNIEVAQFIYLLLNNAKVRDVIDTMTSRIVLILGNFSGERKEALDELRQALRTRKYVPVMFDFEPTGSQRLIETVKLLARMARFVIADLTDAKSVPLELATIVPTAPSVIFQPIILSSQKVPPIELHPVPKTLS
jgi:uncharacterized protein YjbI with pentapeptide repeats